MFKNITKVRYVELDVEGPFKPYTLHQHQEMLDKERTEKARKMRININANIYN